MKLNIPRTGLLTLLQKVIGVVENKQTLPMLANVLIRCADGRLSLTASDTEIELIAEMALSASDLPEKLLFTAPARKLLDICQSLTDGSSIDFSLDDGKLKLHSGKARFSLPTLPAEHFPCFDVPPVEEKFSIQSAKLRRAMDQSKFAMAQQDTRYYLKSLLLEVEGAQLRMVATDGHRLAFCEQQLDAAAMPQRQVVIPVKGVKELSRLLSGYDAEVDICLSDNMLRVLLGDTQFSVKLVDSKYPDFRRVIPSTIDRTISVDKELLKQALARVSVVCHEKFKQVRFKFDDGVLALSAQNPENEEASDALDIDYAGPLLETAYNGSYIMDVLNHCDTAQVRFGLTDSETPCLMEAEGEGEADSKFVVSPLLT